MITKDQAKGMTNEDLLKFTQSRWEGIQMEVKFSARMPEDKFKEWVTLRDELALRHIESEGMDAVGF